MSQRPKIYYIANCRMPTERAHGIQLAKMCEALIGTGLDLELIVPPRATAPQTVRAFYGLSRDIPMRKVPGVDLYLYGKAGFWFSSLVFMVSSALFLLGRKLRGEWFSIYTIDMDQFSFALVPFLGVSYSVEVHDAKQRGILFGLLFRNARGLVVINDDIKEKIAVRFGVAREKIIAHPNGIDLVHFERAEDRLAARARLGMPPDRKVVMYTGKFHTWKGLSALVHLAHDLSGVAYVYVVGGTKDELMRYVDAEIPPNCICVGHVDYKDIPLWLRAADSLVVLGTRTNEYSYFHTSPMKLFEYMAVNRPILAANTPAIRHVAGEKELFLFEPDNPSELARIARFVLFDQSTEIASRVEAARATVKQYTWEKRAALVSLLLSSDVVRTKTRE